MSTTLYCFTGTGNCLALARAMGERLVADVLPIAATLADPDADIAADEVGIVFPAYLAALHGVPLVVERFVRRLAAQPPRRLFAVCTCGGCEIVNAVPTLRNLSRYARSHGLRIAAGYTVRLPMNNLDYEHIPVPIETDTQTIIRRADAGIDDLCSRIRSHRRGRNHVARAVFTVAFTPMYAAMAASCMRSLRRLAHEPQDSPLGFRDLMPLTDRSISVDDSCTGCGTCARVCPASNIVIEHGRPTWLHRCEMCFACDEWCRRQAIHHWGRPDGAKYHHPAVTARDLRAQAPASRTSP